MEARQQRSDPTLDLVADRSYRSDVPARGVVELPIDVALARDGGTRVAAAHRHDDVRPLDVGAVESARHALREVDPALAGRPALTLVEASLEAASDAAVADFKRRVVDCPDVLECYHLAGDSTFLLVLGLADRAELARFSRWLCDGGAARVTLRASPVLDQVKPT